MPPEEPDRSSVSLEMVKQVTRVVETLGHKEIFEVRCKYFGDTVTLHLHRGDQVVLVRIEPLT